MNSRSVVATLFVVASFLMAGCVAEDPVKTSAPAGKKVSMVNVEFDPDSISVKEGESVTWENAESVPHTVTFDDASMSSKNSGNLNKGGKHTVKFDTAGSFSYHCAVPGHATKQADGSWTGMVGNVTVAA